MDLPLESTLCMNAAAVGDAGENTHLQIHLTMSLNLHLSLLKVIYINTLKTLPDLN